jgi:fructose-1,6-bisphosphatase/sedoheptulose 1,7-bisphosphatase-like protein
VITASGVDPALIDALVRATERAAVAARAWAGRGDPMAADGAAVDALRLSLANAPMRGTVVIGEGERDRAPQLAPGERVGRWHADDPEHDVAVDPLECTKGCAAGRPGSWIALAVGPTGGLLAVPDLRMDKRAVGAAGAGLLRADRPLVDDLRALATAVGRSAEHLRVAVLDRPRNAEHLRALQELGIRPLLVVDGDLEPMLALGTALDAFVGIGGAPEGVLAGVGLRALGGQVVGRLLCAHDGERARVHALGRDPDQPLVHHDLARGPAVLVFAPVTGGIWLTGPQTRIFAST